MPKKKAATRNPFETYDFDFTHKRAYLFPSGWSQKEKMKFQSLSAEVKIKVCHDGGGYYYYNREELRIMQIPPDVFTQSSKKP